MNRKTLLLSIFICALTIFGQTTQAQTLLSPGTPDLDFGTNGRVLTQVEGGCDVGDAILMPDNKILSVCTQTRYRDNYAHYYFLLVRHNPNGTPDNTFGAGGVVTIPIGDGPSTHYRGETLYLQPDGKIVIAGTLERDFGMVRVNSDGSLDKSFGEGGHVRTDFAAFEEISTDYFQGLEVRPDGRLIAYGKSIVQTPMLPCDVPWCYMSPEYERLALAQYNADGSLDISFGAGGIQRSRFTNNLHYPQSLIIEPDGKILFIAGVYERAIVYGGWGVLFTQVAARYNIDGNLDADFGKDGIKELPNAEIYSLPDGKFLAYETCDSSYQPCSGYNTRFFRLNSDLITDATFGSNGLAPYYLFNNDNGTIYPQPDGKFIFTSYHYHGMTGALGRTYMYRFNSDGSIDFSFGINGSIGFDLDDSNAHASFQPKIIIQPDGKILAVGAFYPPQNTTGTSGIAMIRFIGRNSKFGF